jgi:hypothetical protein
MQPHVHRLPLLLLLHAFDLRENARSVATPQQRGRPGVGRAACETGGCKCRSRVVPLRQVERATIAVSLVTQDAVRFHRGISRSLVILGPS